MDFMFDTANLEWSTRSSPFGAVRRYGFKFRFEPTGT